jgi:hypothetical protein
MQIDVGRKALRRSGQTPHARDQAVIARAHDIAGPAGCYGGTTAMARITGDPCGNALIGTNADDDVGVIGWRDHST